MWPFLPNIASYFTRERSRDRTITGRMAWDSHLIIWSRSVYGYSNMGVNRARVAGWLAALDRRISQDH